MAAVLDTCFLINWARFKQGEDIFRAFSRLMLPYLMLPEIRSAVVRRRLEEWLYQGRLAILPRSDEVDREALRLFNLINSIPALPRIDEPEAYGLAYSHLHGLPFLTDNASPKVAAMVVHELRGVKVYDSLDVLCFLYKGERLARKVGEFSRDAGIMFSRERLRVLGLERLA